MSQRVKFRILFFLLFLILTTGCENVKTEESTGVPANLTLGLQPDGSELSGLVLLAEDQGMFKKNGLHITYKDYPSGGPALHALGKNEVHLALSAQYVVLKKILHDNNIRIIASIAKSKTLKIAAHKGTGIKAPSDLKGRTVALVNGSQLEFDLERFLILQGLAIDAVKVHKMLTAEAVSDAFITKTVDAAIIWEPYMMMIKEKLENQVHIWPAQSEQPHFWLVTAQEQFIRQNPDAVHRFLRAIRQAEVFMEKTPDVARRAIFNHSGHTQDHFDHILSNVLWELSLDHSLLVAMENEARWLIKNHLTHHNTVPNLLGYFYFDAYQQVKPDGFCIIH